MTVIIFDTETFGRIPSIEEDVKNHWAWAGLKLICWQTYDLNGNLKSTSNHYFDKQDKKNLKY